MTSAALTRRRVPGAGAALGIGRRQLIALAAIAVLLAGWWVMAAPGQAATVDMSAIEQRWGIRVTMIGVTGDGGLLDFRYQVTDADKAGTFLDGVSNLPILIDEQSGATVRSVAIMATMNMKDKIQAGRTYFLLYRNTRGAIRSGSSVSLVFGELRLEHIVVR